MVRDRFDWKRLRLRCQRFRFSRDKRAEGRAILADIKRMLAAAQEKLRDGM